MRRWFALQEQMIGRLARVPLFWLLTFVVVVSLWERYDTLEGRFFPVAEIVSMDEVEILNGHQRIAFTFKKHRDCEFRSVNWYWTGDNGDLVPVPYSVDADFNTTHDRTRPTGVQTSAHILHINLGVEQLIGFVRHNCHPFWDTRTQFYP